MNTAKNYTILILTVLLVVSFTSQPAESAPKYATSADLKKVVAILISEINRKDIQIKQLWTCVNSLEVQLGGDGRQTFCP